LAKPGLEGTVTVNFTLNGNGRVIQSTASGVDAAVSSCIAEVIANVAFPKVGGTGIYPIKYPFQLRPRGSQRRVVDVDVGVADVVELDDRLAVGADVEPAQQRPAQAGVGHLVALVPQPTGGVDAQADLAQPLEHLRRQVGAAAAWSRSAIGGLQPHDAILGEELLLLQRAVLDLLDRGQRALALELAQAGVEAAVFGEEIIERERGDVHHRCVHVGLRPRGRLDQR
jgi:hypothetical protein